MDSPFKPFPLTILHEDGTKTEITCYPAEPFGPANIIPDLHSYPPVMPTLQIVSKQEAPDLREAIHALFDLDYHIAKRNLPA